MDKAGYEQEGMDMKRKEYNFVGNPDIQVKKGRVERIWGAAVAVR